ncbi:MAG TPA: hypothetical protein VJU61_15165, partial [Polyangiaceae bacterium]|nr:hypothetical protein [Polyangiaceae bacterium]
MALLACSGAGTIPRDEDRGANNSSVTPPYGNSPDTSAVNNGSTSGNPPSTPPAATGNGPGANSEGSQTPVQLVPEGTGSAAEGSGEGAAPPAGEGQLGGAMMGGAGQSTDRYAKADVTRDGQNYFLMANGWGPGFQSQSISWSGTSFTIESMQGTEGPNYQPASYPTVFCGAYSDSRSGECGLPAALDSMSALETGWSWRPNGNTGEYNAAYDIWMGTSTERSSFSGYLMVWYREPPGQQPAGARMLTGVTVANVSGTWDIWTGRVGNRPIINWVRAEGQDTTDMEFDVLDFVRDAQMRGLEVPGTHVLSVAVGFEMWGPVSNLQSLDFYVD